MSSEINAVHQACPDRILRSKEVVRMTGLSVSTHNRLIQEGVFPKPIRIAKQAVGWLQSDITNFIAERIKASRTGDEK